MSIDHAATFELSAERVHKLTSSLRADAAALYDVPFPTIPAVGPVAAFARACHDAIASVNERSAQLRDEAQRLSDVMDLTARTALGVDTDLARALGVLQP
ncbi:MULTISPECIES: hypothetical protein [unclassified Corynebacterium]|uniref:hypothetical protein n=1 Tax=unclassified Corynebacterium TaxID=2624378 RepID=UPI002A90DCD8|nr:hypothetical protein [Corynebacterium sp.]MDY5785504.1 hypothetical protein [Corynebacterium sp.]